MLDSADLWIFMIKIIHKKYSVLKVTLPIIKLSYQRADELP